MTTFFLLRHFPTEDNERGLILGQTDCGTVIRREFTGLTALRNSENALAIFSSTARRCVETSAELARHLDIDSGAVLFTPLLLERNMGMWEGLDKSILHEQHPEVFSNGVMNPFFHPPGGESFRRFFCRVSSAIDLISETSHDSVIPILVSHNQTLKPVTHLIRHDFTLSNWFSLIFQYADLVPVESLRE